MSEEIVTRYATEIVRIQVAEIVTRYATEIVRKYVRRNVRKKGLKDGGTICPGRCLDIYIYIYISRYATISIREFVEICVRELVRLFASKYVYHI